MPIYDNNGTTNAEIGSLYDNNGTASCQIGEVYDNNGTTNSLIFSSEYILLGPGAKEETWVDEGTKFSGSSGIQFSGDTLRRSVRAYKTGTTYWAAAVSSVTMDITSYSTVTFVWSLTNTGQKSSRKGAVGIDINPGWKLASDYKEEYTDAGTEVTSTIDISALTGEHKICIAAQSSNSDAGASSCTNVCTSIILS